MRKYSHKGGCLYGEFSQSFGNNYIIRKSKQMKHSGQSKFDTHEDDYFRET